MMTESGLVGSSGRGTTSAEDAQGTPTKSHIPPSILLYEDKKDVALRAGGQQTFVVHQRLQAGSYRLFQVLGLYRRSPESDGVWKGRAMACEARMSHYP